MRVNFIIRLGLILLILSAAMMLNFQQSYMPISSIRSVFFGSDEILSYSVFTGPVGLGNVIVGYHVLPGSPSRFPSSLPIQIPDEVVLPIHLVIVNPLNVTLVDVDIVTPCYIPIDFDKRGEYVVHITNLTAEDQDLFPVGLNFPNESGDGVATGRDVDKFFCSMILAVSGVLFFCLGLLITLIQHRHHHCHHDRRNDGQ